MAATLLSHHHLLLPGQAAFRLRLPPIHSLGASVFHYDASPPSLISCRIPRLPRTSATSQGASGGFANEDSSSSSSWSNVAHLSKPLLSFLVPNFLPIALVTGLTLALINPNPGCLAYRYGLSKFTTFGIFLISGLMMQDGEITAAKEAWPVGIYGLVSILVLSPFLSKVILQLHFKPQEFVTGLAIFCCVPTTLSSGVALTTLVKGNSALALAMTVISNLLGILIVPFTLSKLVAGGVGVSLPTRQLFKNLTATLLVPLVLGKVFRNSHHSKLAALSGNASSSFSKKENARAVVLVASEKTLPVMAAIVEHLGGALGESGLLVLPGVAAHINQIIFDSFVVNFWLHKDLSSDK